MNNSQITSLGAVLTLATAISGVAAAPQIRATSSLQHKAVDLAQNTSFGVTAVGDAPLFYQWVSGTVEPNLRINTPAEAFVTTGAVSIDLVGVAAALGQAITQLRWINTVNKATGIATAANVWDVTGVPLVPDKTNVVMVTATTTSWAPAFGGNTTFNDTLTVVCKPIRATLAMQGGDTVLDWSGGAPPNAVQRATDLGKGDWSDFLTSCLPPLMLPPEGKAGFYRVLGQ